MLVEFSILPVGEGVSLSAPIAEALEVVEASGVPYDVGPMGTTLEGGWDDVFRVIRDCHARLMKRSERVIISIKVDDRKDHPVTLQSRLQGVQAKFGKPLKRVPV